MEENDDEKLVVEYYQLPFILFNMELQKSKKMMDHYEVRRSFWSLIPDGEYRTYRATQLLTSYQNSIERQLKSIISKQSLAYWLYVSRRVAPYTNGDNKDPGTILNTRVIALTAIQKYGKLELCEKLRPLGEVGKDAVFNGLLRAEQMEVVYQSMDNMPENHLVLTDFEASDLETYYKVEELAYEMWVCGSKSRAIAKGASLLVSSKHKELINEDRSDELHELILSYDSRGTKFGASSAAVVFEKPKSATGTILLPVLNVGQTSFKDLEPVLSQMNIKGDESSIPNFLPFPFSLIDFYKAHLPFSEGFEKKYGFKLNEYCVFIESLSAFQVATFSKSNLNFINFIQRGYYGSILRENIIKQVISISPHFIDNYGCSELTEDTIDLIIDFCSTNRRDDINLPTLGPLALLVPIEQDNFYIDYTILPEKLRHLFWGITLDNQTFKGQLLEDAINLKTPHVHGGELKSRNDGSREIDYSQKIGDILVIVECKAVNMGFGMFLGQYKAIKYREEKVVNRSLAEVDDKARWLARNPIGTNYDISDVKFILPIGVSAFEEYIHSLDERYWIDETTPRVLSFAEFNEFINSDQELNKKKNLIPVSVIPDS